MPLLADRSLSTITHAAFQKRHYKALLNMGMRSGSFFPVLVRYLSGKGSYPYRCDVRTPAGDIHPQLFSYYDLLTLNEIFFREDYLADAADHVIVDIGSNIGLSALYFLTRNTDSKCFLFEPDPKNVDRLKNNLSAFSNRIVLESSAVSDQAGTLQFGLDVNTGRYGGLKADFGHFMKVNCLHINTVLENVLNQNSAIDILKIDTEGVEIQTLKAIDPLYLKKIRKIYIEAEPKELLHADLFQQTQSGTVCRFVNKNF